MAWDVGLRNMRTGPKKTWEEIYPLDSFPNATTTALVNCPSCSKTSSTLDGNFHWGDLEAGCLCPHCRKTCPAYKWKCQCDMLWYTCHQHRFMCKKPMGKPLRMETPTQDSPAPKRRCVDRPLKRTPSNEYAHLLKEDEAIHKAMRLRLSNLAMGLKRKAKLILSDRHPLVKRPTLLGPILSNRFGPAAN